MDPLVRRQLLVLLSALGSCAFAPSGGAVQMAASTLADPLQALPLHDIRIAARRLAGRDNLRDAVTEIRRILAEAGPTDAAIARVAERSRADFTEGKWTKLDGWRLSYTDAAMIVVLASL